MYNFLLLPKKLLGITFQVAPLFNWNFTGFPSTWNIANNIFYDLCSFTEWLLIVSCSTFVLIVRQYSSSSLSLSAAMALTCVLHKHFFAKWFTFLQFRHFLPNAGHFSRITSCRLHSLFFFTSFWVSYLNFLSFLGFVISVALYDLFFGRNELMSSRCSRAFLNSFDYSAALQAFRHRSKSRFGSFNISSRSCLSLIPQIVRFRTSDSFRLPKLQLAARTFKSVTNCSRDSFVCRIRMKNLYLSTISFFFGLQWLPKAIMTCSKVLSCGWKKLIVS